MWKLLADILEYHRSLISDQARCQAFRDAIHRRIKPGDVAVDLGTGTGLLAMFAVQAGARHVYALEEGMIADLAEQLFRENGMEKQITLIRGRSWNVDLPEKADVVVSETLWNFGLGEGILKTLGDAKRRFLQPEGCIIPEKMTLIVAPVHAPSEHERLAQWNTRVGGIDVSAVYKMAKSNVYRKVIAPEALIAAPQTICELTLGEDPEWVRGNAEFIVPQASQVHGLAGWFDAKLCSEVHAHNAPPSPAPSWKHAYLPFDQPIEVQEGDRLCAEIHCVGDESAWRWAIRHHRADAASAAGRLHAQSTLGGFPTALERLTAP